MRRVSILDNLGWECGMINVPKVSCHTCIHLQSIELDSLEKTAAFSAAVLQTQGKMWFHSSLDRKDWGHRCMLSLTRQGVAGITEAGRCKSLAGFIMFGSW